MLVLDNARQCEDGKPPVEPDSGFLSSICQGREVFDAFLIAFRACVLVPKLAFQESKWKVLLADLRKGADLTSMLIPAEFIRPQSVLERLGFLMQVNCCVQCTFPGCLLGLVSQRVSFTGRDVVIAERVHSPTVGFLPSAHNHASLLWDLAARQIPRGHCQAQHVARG